MGTVFLKLLNLSISASVLVIIAVLFRVIFKKAPRSMRVVMWGLVALRLIIPFTVESPFGLAPEPDVNGAAIERITRDTAEAETPSGEGLPVISVDDAVEKANTPVWDDPAPERGGDPAGSPAQTPAAAPARTAEEETVKASALTEDAIASWRRVTDIAAVVWISGTALILAYAAYGYSRMKRKVAEAIPMCDNVWICDNIDTPFILGVFRPRIYLMSDISSGDARLVIAHEKAHISRLDHVWKPLGFILLAVYWFNPFIWLAFILFSHDIEFACDEKVLKEATDADVKRNYSMALVNCSAPGKPLSPSPLGFAEVSVKERVKDVLHYKKPTLWIMTAALIAIFVTAACLMTSPLEKADEVLYERKTGYDDFSYEGGRVNEYSADIVMDSGIDPAVLSSEGFSDLREADFMAYEDKLYARNFIRGGKMVTEWTELGSFERFDFGEKTFDAFLPEDAALINGTSGYYVIRDEYDEPLPDYVDLNAEGGQVVGSTSNELDRRAMRYDIDNYGCTRVRWIENDNVSAFIYYGNNYICLGYQTRDTLPVIYRIVRTGAVLYPPLAYLNYDLDGDGIEEKLTLSLEEKGEFNVYKLVREWDGKKTEDYMYFPPEDQLGLATKTSDSGVTDCILQTVTGEEQAEGYEQYYILGFENGRPTARCVGALRNKKSEEILVKGVSGQEKGDPGRVVSYVEKYNENHRNAKDVFYEDDGFEYCFSYKKCANTAVTTADLKTRTLDEAVRDGIIALGELTDYPNNSYWKIDKKTREYYMIDFQGNVVWTSSGRVDTERGKSIVDHMKRNYNVYGYATYDIDGDGREEYIAIGYGPNKVNNFPVNEKTDFIFTVTVEENGKREYFGIFDLGEKQKVAMRLGDGGKPYLYTYEGKYVAPENRVVTSTMEISVADGRVSLVRDGTPVPYWDGMASWGY